MKSAPLYALRWHFLLLAACLVAASVVIHQSWQHYNTNKVLANRAVQQAHEISSVAQQLAANESAVRQHSDYFLELKARGMLNTENVTKRTALFRQLQRELRIEKIEHEFSLLTPLSSDEFPAKVGGYQSQVSQLGLRMSLLHEEDLLHFLHQLNERAPALLRLHECQLSLAAEPAEHKAPPILASCRLTWITFSKVKGG